jgi:hypothetical protein
MGKITETLASIGDGFIADPILILIVVLIAAKIAGVF